MMFRRHDFWYLWYSYLMVMSGVIWVAATRMPTDKKLMMIVPLFVLLALLPSTWRWYLDLQHRQQSARVIIQVTPVIGVILWLMLEFAAVEIWLSSAIVATSVLLMLMIARLVERWSR